MLHPPSGPMMALCLAREDAVEKWREMLGPKELEVAKQQAPARYKLLIKFTPDY